MAGGAEQDLACLSRVAADLLGSGEVDALLVSGYFGGYAEYGPELAAAELAVAGRLGDVMAETGRPILVQTLFPVGEAAAALRARGIPVFRRTESAITSLSHLTPTAPPDGTGARRSRASAAPPDSAAPPGSAVLPPLRRRSRPPGLDWLPGQLRRAGRRAGGGRHVRAGRCA